MMFKSYTAARLAASKPKKCKRCGIKNEKLQGYCADCLSIDSPEMRAIVCKYLAESQANTSLGKVFVIITITIALAMALFI